MITGTKVSKALLFILLFGIAFLPGRVAPASGAMSSQEPQFTLDQLSALLSMRPRRYANFEEIYFSNLLSEPLRIKGTLTFIAPSRLEKRVTAPHAESYIADGDVVVYENTAKRIHQTVALEDYPLLGALVQTLRATFAGDLVTLVKLYHPHLKGNPDHWELTLEPKEGPLKGAIASVMLQGQRERITRLEIHEPTGDHSQIRIGEIR